MALNTKEVLMRTVGFLTVIAVVLLAASAALTNAPNLINYQGVLLDGSGNPVTSPTTVKFRIWNAATGGSQLWIEPRLLTPDAQGRFSVLLGELEPISDALFADAAYLGITVAPDPDEMSPRQRLASVACSCRTRAGGGGGGGASARQG